MNNTDTSHLPISEVIQTEGKRKTTLSGNSDVWLLNLDQIEANTGKVHTKSHVNPNDVGNSTFAFCKGTVLYSKLRPYLNKVVVADEDGVATTELVPLVVNRDLVTPEYLAYYLRSEVFVTFASAVVAGAKMPRMVMSEFWTHKIPLPPLPEQKRIAALLDEADRQRSLARQQLAEFDKLAEAVFVEKFGHGKPHHTSLKLEELCSSPEDVQCGPFGTQISAKDYSHESGVPLWGIRHVNSHFTKATDEFVTSEKADELSVYALKPYDLVMTRKGTIGNCAIYPPEFPRGIMHSDLLRIRVNFQRVLPQFLSNYFRYNRDVDSQIKAMSQGAIMAGINVRKLKSVICHIPPMTEQQEYVHALTELQLNHEQVKKQHNDSETLFQSLMHQSFGAQ